MSYSEFWFRPMAVEKQLFHSIKEDLQKMKALWNEKRISLKLLEIEDGNEVISLTAGESTLEFPRVVPEDFRQYFLSMKDGRIFQFTNVRNRSYGLAVQILLIIAKHHLKDELIVTSNGEDYEWEPAREHVHEALGYGKDFTLGESPTYEEMGLKMTVHRYDNGEYVPVKGKRQSKEEV